MAKQIVAWCDYHLAQDEEVPATAVTVTLGNGTPMEVDLCEPCEKELVEPLRLLLEEYGQPTKDAEGGGSSNTLHCPMPGCVKAFTHGRNLQKHMERVHERVLPDSVLGADQVVQSTTKKGKKVYPCPDCDREFTRAQGVSAHRHHVHGYESPRKK